MAKQELYLVFGGTLVDTRENVLADPTKADLIGIYPSYDDALAAWRAKSQANVDDAYVRYFVAPLHELMFPEEQPD